MRNADSSGVLSLDHLFGTSALGSARSMIQVHLSNEH